jgi:hypothetical protein
MLTITFSLLQNRKQLLQTLSGLHGLTYISILDYETIFNPTRGLDFAKELMKREAMDLKTIVCIPCPSGPKAVIFRYKEVSHKNGIIEDVSAYDGWNREWVDLDEDSDF